MSADAPKTGVAGRLRHELRYRLDASTMLFPLQMRLRGHGARLAGPKTALAIEGYPRSANTFAVAAFQYAQPAPLELAHHTHSPANVVCAARLGVPTLVLVRDPRAAVASLLVREPTLAASTALDAYLAFYRPVLSVRRQVVVAAFEEIVRDFGKVIDRINARYGTGFARFERSAESMAAVERAVEEMERADSGQEQLRETHVARPSRARAAAIAERRKALTRRPLAPRLARARSLHRLLVDDSARSAW